MTNTTHTPGPWKVQMGWVHPILEHGSNGNDSYAICEPFGPDRAANARLIAAAPDMYEALTLLKLKTEKWRNEKELQECFVIMDAALAKARGE